MDTLYGYMSESELALAREEAKTTLEGDRLFYEYDMLEKEHELRLKEIELKSILMEDCTAYDLVTMYEDENESHEEKKEGILSRIWEWIKGIFNAIIGRNKKIIEYIKVENTYTVNYDLDEFKNILTKFKNGFSSAISTTKDLSESGLKEFFGDYNVEDKCKKDAHNIKGSELKSELEDINSKISACKTEIDKLENTLKNNKSNKALSVTGGINKLRNVVTQFQTIAGNIGASVKSGEGIKDDNDNDNKFDIEAIKNAIEGYNGKFNTEEEFGSFLKKFVKTDEDANKVADAIKSGAIEIKGVLGDIAEDKFSNFKDGVVDFLKSKFSSNKKEENKEEGKPVADSAHDVDYIYNSIFESLDIDTIDSIFESANNEYYNKDIDEFSNILSELLS